MPEQLEIIPVLGIGDVAPGTDLAGTIAAAAPWLRDGDVLVVTSKIVSKAEGQLVDVPTSGPEREATREETLTAETARLVARRGHTRIVETHHGFVMASAGVDASNVERSKLVLLPKDPDASARQLRSALRERFGLDVAVIVSDTMGRPWRTGLTDVALGAAGIEPIRDHRGETDAYGNELHITQMAVIDELSAAAELVKGKRDQVPVAVVRGYFPSGPGRDDGPGAAALIRDSQHDLFSLGTAEARAAGLAAAAGLPEPSGFGVAPVHAAVVARAMSAVAVAPDTLLVLIEASAQTHLPVNTAYVVACGVTAPEDPNELVALGADVHRLRCALAAEDLLTIWLPSPGPGRIGLLAIGNAVT